MKKRFSKGRDNEVAWAYQPDTMVGAALKKTAKFKAGQKVLCRILSKEDDGYSVSVREMAAKAAKAAHHSAEDELVEGFPGFFPTTTSYEVGDLITAMFVCVGCVWFFVSTRYMM